MRFVPLRVSLRVPQPLLYAACAGERPAVGGLLLARGVSQPRAQLVLDAVIMR
jgi:hypothetical protein